MILSNYDTLNSAPNLSRFECALIILERLKLCVCFFPNFQFWNFPILTLFYSETLLFRQLTILTLNN